MIDTLARHMAALREARRLAGMVLANNGAFTALQAAVAEGDGARIAASEAALETDKVYLAYRLLEQAIAEVEPPAPPPGGSGALLDTITLINPGERASEPGSAADLPRTQAAAQSMDDAPDSLAERLQRVLALTAMDNEQPAPKPRSYDAAHTEARVSIVHREAPMVFSATAHGTDYPHPQLVRLLS